jgi:hypothetical protein
VDGANFAGRRSLEPGVSAACRLSEGPLTRTTGIASCIYILWLIFTSITIHPLFSLPLLVWQPFASRGRAREPPFIEITIEFGGPAVPRFICVGLAVR